MTEPNQHRGAAAAPRVDRAPQLVLVPVEFSECSQRALDYAVDLASALGLSLRLLHVWAPPVFATPEALVLGPGGVRETLWQHVQRQAEQDLRASVHAATARGARVVAERLECGDPASAILEDAERAHVDLIVMGTHGRQGIAHLALGSVAERVLRRARCPVLTVPCQPPLGAPPRVG